MDYEKQATDFLKKTGTEFKVKFVKHGKHFEDDTEDRDIYEITLKRGNREYKFKFGQSLNDSGLMLYDLGGERTQHKGFTVPADIRTLLMTAETTQQKRKSTYIFKEWFEIKHFSLSGLTYGFKEPTAYDVLACLQNYDVGNFEFFCSSFGYDTDSRKAEKTFKLVVDEYNNLKMLYSNEEMELLGEIK